VRQAQGSIVCAQCNQLVGVNEETCPFCGAWRPGLFGWAPVLRSVIGTRLDQITLIVGATVTLYVLALLLQPEAIMEASGFLSILSPGGRALYQLGMTGGVAWELGWWWTLLTAIYLHGGLLHIFFNVMWIRNLGPVASDAYGPARAFVLFNISGAAGFLVSNTMSGAPTIGASGAIFGLLAALIVYGQKRGQSMLTKQLWQWAIILGVFGFVMPSVNNWAHGGGFVGGWLAAQFMGFSDEHRESTSVMLTSLVLILLTAVGFVLSFFNVTGILLAG
jgi:rhomboid protease GluP